MGKTNDNIKDTQESIRNGIALSISFLVIALFLYFFPDYIGKEVMTKGLYICFSIIGIAGLSIELNKLDSRENKLGLDNLGIGLAFIIIWATIYHYFSMWLLNILILPILIFGLYGLFLGLIGIIENILLNDFSIKKLFTRLPIIIIQLSALVLTLLEIIEILQISED